MLTLGLASGLATAVFSVWDATLVRALPFPHEDRIVSIGSRWSDAEHASVSIPEYLDYRARAHSLASTAAYQEVNANLVTPAAGPERLQGAAVTSSFFDVLGVTPVAGRVFTPDEDRPGGDSVVVIGFDLWRRRFGGATSVVGRTVRLNDTPFTVIGVLPPAVRFPERETDLWVPLTVDEANPGGRGAHSRQVIARLRDGVTFEAARDELAAIGKRLATEYPSIYPAGSGWGVDVIRLRTLLTGDVRDALQLLFAAVLFVLLVAAANVSGLMIARASERQRELAARAALGASRYRLVRLMVIEGVLAGLAGGAVGLGLADLLLRVLTLAPGVVRPDGVGLDWRALLFALAATGAAAAAAAGIAAVQASRTRGVDALRSSRGASVGRSARRLRTVLVVAELAVASMLLVGAGLAVRSYTRLTAIDPGLVVSDVSTARLSLPSSSYPTGADAVQFYERLLPSIQMTPGVRYVGAISILPFSGSTSDANVGVEGYVPPTPGQGPNAQFRLVDGELFRALGVPLIEGRPFTAGDDPDHQVVAIVNQALASQYWRGERPVGRRIKLWSLDDPGPWRTVVGVVGNVRQSGLGEPPPPTLYLPVRQYPQRTMTVVVKTAGAAADEHLIEERVGALDPTQPVFDARTMQDWMAESNSAPRLSLVLLTLFGAAAVTFAALGVYGVMAFTVSARSRELGICVALGANPRALARAVVLHGLLLAGVGLALGLGGGLLAGRSLAASLYGIRPVEPVVDAAAVVILAGVAVLACVLPARRILGLDSGRGAARRVSGDRLPVVRQPETWARDPGPRHPTPS